MRPITFPVVIKQGDSFTLPIRMFVKGSKIEGRDLTGWTGKCQIRTDTVDAGGTVLASMAFALADQVAPETRGWVFFTLTPAETTALTQGGFYDAEIQNAAGTERHTPASGPVTIIKEYTR